MNTSEWFSLQIAQKAYFTAREHIRSRKYPADMVIRRFKQHWLKHITYVRYLEEIAAEIEAQTHANENAAA